MKKTVKIAIISLIIILIAVTIFILLKRKESYEFVAPRKGEVVEAIYGLGKVKTNRKYEIKLGVLTTVKTVFVKEGQLVNKNDPLIQFTDSNIFKAPFTGTVTILNAEAPEVVFPQTTILKLEDLNDKYVEVSLEQKDVLRVKKGQNAHILFESLRGNKLKGIVETIFPKNDEFIVNIKVENLSKNILPGMTADVTIDVAYHHNALLIPITGLTNGQVLTLRSNGKKEKVAVKIGSIDGEWAQVLDGDIREGDKVLMKTRED